MQALSARPVPMTAMAKLILLTGLALLLNAQLVPARPGCFKPDDIDPCLCTHLIYAFAGMRNNEITTTEWDDVTFYQAFNGLKNNFTAMVSTPENLQNFIASVIKFLRQYEFDGLDFDWEYPGSCGSPPQDKHLFTVPVQEMRDAFEQEAKQINRPRLMVTAAVAAGISNIQCGYEILQLSQYLDYIHVMTYDLPGSWEGYTAENSPLYKYPTDKGSNAYLNVDYVMNYWKENGAPAEKLIVGFPTYGHTVILSDPSNTGIGAPTSGAGPPGPSTRQSGFWAYYEICTFLKNGATQAWDTPRDVPYAYQGNQWVGYDNVKSFDIKAQWLKENNFGGAMVWAIDLDDFTGTFCNQGQVPPDQYPEESPWTAECKDPELTALHLQTFASRPLVSSPQGNLGAPSRSTNLLCAISGCTGPAKPVEPITSPPSGGSGTGSGSGSGSSGSSSGGSSVGSGFCAGKAKGFYPVVNNRNAFWHRRYVNGVTYQQNCQVGLVFDPSCECCNWT